VQALTRGYNDFSAMPSHAVFLCVIYPLLGLLLIAMTVGYSMSLAFPLAAGFALIGPLAAIGLYELSWRREAGLDCSAGHAGPRRDTADLAQGQTPGLHIKGDSRHPRFIPTRIDFF
jgi:uncharacterized membrane protein